MDEQKNDNPSVTEIEPQVDGFEIVEQLGRGGTSSVWKARQISLQRFVVIKVLAEHFSKDNDDIKQFRLEAQIAANLKHPGIVQVYDFGQSREDKRYYFIMEYVSGYTVGEWLRRREVLPETDALVVVHSVAAALGYAWEKSGIVHCDIKPDNVMVDGDGTIKLTDLGLAQVVSTIGHASGKSSEFVMGTPNYMSPEQVRGEVKLDCRSDIYSLGMTLYHLVTGKLPFMSNDPAEVMEKQIHDVLPHPQQVNPALSPAMAQLVARMTAKNPAERCQNWEEVLSAVTSLEKRSVTDTASQPAVQPADDVQADINCRHCGKTMREKTPFCRHCGKSLQPDSTAPKVKLRVKPLSELKPAPPVAPRIQPRPPVPARAPARRRRSFFAVLMANLRMLLSLALLIFLGYSAYQKIVNDVDVIAPLRRDAHLAWRRARMKFLDRGTKSPAPVETFRGDYAPGLDDYDAEIEAAPETDARIPDQVVQPERVAPAALSQEALAVNEEYLRLLELCRQDAPKPGDQVVMDLKHQSEKREGILRGISDDGVEIEVPSGVIKVPFNVMSDEYRLRYFPEDRARMLFYRQSGN